MGDRYGSASLEDIQAFSRAFAAAMEARLGEQRAGEIETEVSSVVRRLRSARRASIFSLGHVLAHCCLQMRFGHATGLPVLRQWP